jgi:hypothetical protein
MPVLYGADWRLLLHSGEEVGAQCFELDLNAK